MAGDPVDQEGGFPPAQIEGQRTARIEGAAGGRVDRVRDLALDRNALAAGKFVRVFQSVIGVQADEIEQFADACPNVGLALDQVEGADRLRDDGVDPEARIEARIGILKNHLDAAAQFLPRLRLLRIGHRYAVDDHATGTRWQQPDHHARYRGLAGAGFADQRKGLAAPDVEGDAIDRLEVFELAAF